MNAKRVTLTKKQLASGDVVALVALLKEITSDGELSLGEIEKLKMWLEQRVSTSDVAALHYLLETVKSVLLDGRVSAGDRLEIMLAVERVLPVSDRRDAKQARLRAQATTLTHEDQEDDEDEDSATEPQLAYIRALGGVAPQSLTKWKASEMITELKSRPAAVSQRQMMVLRFWNRMELVEGGRAGVSEWMDDWYAKDPMHLEAWELYKSESGDNGGQGDPHRVPLGEGLRYVQKLRYRDRDNPFAEGRTITDSGDLSLRWFLIILAIGALVGLAAVYFRGL